MKYVPRRTFLRGLGTSVSLPLLDAMIPAFAAADTLKKAAPPRMAFVYIPNGVEQKFWEIGKAGPLTELSRILQPLEPVRDQFSLFTGLAQNKAALNKGGDHATALAAYLTGVQCKKTEGADIVNGVSIDQLVARQAGADTRLASLELGIEDGRQVGICDPGYSCAYSNNLSWRSPTLPNPPEINPRAVFERMFGANAEDPQTHAKNNLYQKSILDLASEDARSVTRSLGPTDRRKVDEYLTAVREIEQQIERTEKQSTQITPDIAKPTGIPVDYKEHVRLMYDLMRLAFQANLTRVITFMLGREQTGRAFREIGISDGFHPLTHHRNDPEMVEKVTKIDIYITEQFLYFLEKMKATPDGEGSLLDHSMIVYGAGLGDGNGHTHNDLPVLIAGKALGVPNGRNLVYPRNTPMTNLFLTMVDRMGMNVEQFADSTGKLQLL